ncbi:MAG: tRNA 2-thiouridine(34) synthase MnmA [Planctomycetaceae bacterium]|nr:tRNA 2-thiouridine(34) synthase MnmA [Planctomycetaceae bacterium]
MDSVLIAMSGGVDSSVAAWKMKQTGAECRGATMNLFDRGQTVCPSQPCSPPETAGNAAADAMAVAQKLGIPFHVFHFQEEFKRHVIERFVQTYLEGKTPNPCVYCNRFLKFGQLFVRAKELGADVMATGHYARIEHDAASNRFLLKKAADETKDQSYVLYTMTQEQLSRTRFPLGMLRKSEVRQIAAECGFANAGKQESQDLCFVPGGDYAGFIEQYTNRQSPPGNFVNKAGKVLGQHKGLIRYTVGQRKGLGIAAPAPYYVCGHNVTENTVILGSEEDLCVKTLTAADINLIPFAAITGTLRVMAKVRYRQKGDRATVIQTGANELRVEFDEPQKGVAEGQAVVLYDGDCVIGGGTIVSVSANQ